MQDVSNIPPSIGDLSSDIVGALAESMQGEAKCPAFVTVNGYEPLAAVLENAYEQAAFGKGKARHANGRSFTRQPIMEIGRMCGLGYPTGQAQKKTQEACGMFSRGQYDAAEAELLGAINYLAVAIMLIREQR